MKTPIDTPWPDGTAPGRYGLQQSHALCEAIRAQWAGTDPLAAAAGNPRWRALATPLYAFARRANTFADDPAYDGVEHEALAAWEDHLQRAYHGEAEHPVFVALGDVTRRFGIPVAPLAEILIAFRLDALGTQPTNFSDLLEYCRLSAGSVGRLVLYALDEAHPPALARVEALAIGLRLIDIVDDLPRDLSRGRNLIPAEDWIAFEVDERSVAAGFETEAVRELLEFQLARAATWLARGRPLLRVVGPQARAVLEPLWIRGQARITTKLARLRAHTPGSVDPVLRSPL